MLLLKTQTEPASVTWRFFKKTRQWAVPEKKNVSVNFCHTLFSLLDFLYLEDNQAVPKRRDGNTALCCVISQNSTDLTR
jgi:hypothetical protein